MPHEEIWEAGVSGPPQPMCKHQGKTYLSGETMSFDEDPCLECTCHEAWTGQPERDSKCTRNRCNSYFQYATEDLDRRAAGCLPVYEEGICCPDYYDCGDNARNTTTPLATDDEIESGDSCVFNGSHYQIGQLLHIHPHNCVKCECVTPPEFTCVYEPNCFWSDFYSSYVQLMCEHLGESYADGERMSFDEYPCLECTCHEGWTGQPETDSQCTRNQCNDYGPRTKLELAKKEAGCLPVYEEGICCPLYDCGNNARNTTAPLATDDEIESGDSCVFNGSHYRIGQLMHIDSRNCVKCECVTPPAFTCVRKTCPSPIHPPGFRVSCSVTYIDGVCCPNIECKDWSANRQWSVPGPPQHICKHRGETYTSGERMSFDEDPCLECTCHEAWTGQPETDSQCIRDQCDSIEEYGTEYLDKMAAGCLPVYEEGICCPLYYDCGEYARNTTSPLATDDEIESGDACFFNGSHYRIGQLFYIGDPDNCVKCECVTPPEFTCVLQTCRSPNSYVNCSETYVDEVCCPHYECSEEKNDDDDDEDNDRSANGRFS